jgi:uncharacterized protein (TIGR03118 family)
MKFWCSGLMAGVAACALVACGGGDGGSMPPPMSGYAVTSLVSNVSLSAYSTAHTDAHLVNAWGIAFNPQGFVWVADNGSDSSTLYDGNGVPQSLVVTTPPSPTGIVFNPTGDFVLTQGTASGVSPFIFAGEDGALSAWSPDVDANVAVTVHDGSASGASYKGLALAAQGTANFLYATDFHNNKIDVFDATFAPVVASGGFVDPDLPPGFAPFGIQTIGSQIVVTYAKQDADAHDDVSGAGLGIVDLYDTAGTLVKRLVTGGALNAPWGIAMAPADFGRFANALLIANFGDGHINAYDPSSGALLGTLSDANGTPIAIDGLWGIAFGNGLNGQPTNTLFFTAGPNDEANGLYGRIDLQ